MSTTNVVPPTSGGSQVKLYRVRKGQQVSGVCKGLEVCGKGNAIFWRLLFVFTGFYIIGAIVYAIMTAVVPLATQEEEDALFDGLVVESGGTAPSQLDRIERDLAKISEMKGNGLITEEEYAALRKKALGLE